jgi:c-di-GMP-binding flagellar brake protein YcgR
VVDEQGATLRGELTDLSSAGMALRLDDDTSLKVGTVLRDISLSIKGARILATGVVVAKRQEDGGGKDVHIVMFAPDSLDDSRREKLKAVVSKINQLTMDLALERA